MKTSWQAQYKVWFKYKYPRCTHVLDILTNFEFHHKFLHLYTDYFHILETKQGQQIIVRDLEVAGSILNWINSGHVLLQYELLKLSYYLLLGITLLKTL